MMVGAKVCNLTEDLLWFVCGLYVVILTSSLSFGVSWVITFVPDESPPSRLGH